MSSVIQAVFGGKTEKTTSAPTDATPADVSAFRQNVFFPAIQSYLESGGGPDYSGPLNAPIGANEQNLLDLLMADASGGPNSRQQLLSNTLAGNFLPGGPNANPFMDAAVQAAQRSTKDALFDVLDRTLPGRFTAAGQFVQPQGTSNFDREAGNVAIRGAQALGDIASKMYGEGYQFERGQQTQAIQLSQQEVDTTIKNLQAQALPRLIEEVGIDRAIDLFKSKSQNYLQALQIATGAGGMVNIGQQSEGTSKAYGGIIPALFPNGIGGGSVPGGAA